MSGVSEIAAGVDQAPGTHGHARHDVHHHRHGDHDHHNHDGHERAAAGDARAGVDRSVEPRQSTSPRGSLLMASATVRVAGALGLIAVLWMAVAWALAGSP